MDTDQRTSLVPDGFAPPTGLVTASFLLEPLGPQHNESDYDAWTSSMEHIRATPGYPDGNWPHSMTLEQNRGDLERHQRDFQTRKGFTYTVLDPESRSVIGCGCGPARRSRSTVWSSKVAPPWTSPWSRGNRCR